ncbi:uncharacterized transposon-derived protein F54H12.3 [Trichonephila clavipes]|nr:uncharacterized transposon-derived protein F54H12.3 [Trichonephila clavipes]
MVMSETHSKKRKFGKAGESSVNKKASREVSKKYGKFTEDCIPDGVFPIGDDVFVFASTYYDSASVHIRRFKKYGKTYYPTPEGITLDPRWIEYIMRKKKVPESLEELPSGLFPPERHIQITIDMQSLAEFNKGYKYLLTCIDLFSKFAWAVPLKDKFGKSVKSGLEIIFKERKPKVLQTDADATSKPYGYLLIDLKPETDESLRVRTGFNGRRKTILYLQVLQKYTHFSNENRRESEPVPNAASLSENQETESLKENLKESVVKTEKEVFEDEIFRIVPARYKEKAKNIFQFLKLQESFSWNSDGEIIYKNTVIPRSNIAFLVNDFLRNRKSAPEGRYVFLRALNDVNLPKNLDVNKKLYQNNKIIKKPIMYARRNAWLKL